MVDEMPEASSGEEERESCPVRMDFHCSLIGFDGKVLRGERGCGLCTLFYGRGYEKTNCTIVKIKYHLCEIYLDEL